MRKPPPVNPWVVVLQTGSVAFPMDSYTLKIFDGGEILLGIICKNSTFTHQKPMDYSIWHYNRPFYGISWEIPHLSFNWSIIQIHF